ncbi:MAG: ribonuclease P protein component [Eubacteriales bacterium]|nr:ribonuclease P protein component [Eubacteriales bacterium]
MKRCYSLKRNKDFHFTHRVGKAVGCRLFTLIYAQDKRKKRPPKNASRKPPVPNVHVGFSASKKIGNSVVRNRAKRRMRAAFSPYLFHVRPGWNLIFVAKEQALTAPYPQLEQSMAHLLKKAELWQETPTAPPREAAE